MRGPEPGIHNPGFDGWMAGSSPAMTRETIFSSRRNGVLRQGFGLSINILGVKQLVGSFKQLADTGAMQFEL